MGLQRVQIVIGGKVVHLLAQEKKNEGKGEVGVGNEGRGGRRKRAVGFERREVAVMSAVQKKGTIRRTHRHTQIDR